MKAIAKMTVRPPGPCRSVSRVWQGDWSTDVDEDYSTVLSELRGAEATGNPVLELTKAGSSERVAFLVSHIDRVTEELVLA